MWNQDRIFRPSEGGKVPGLCLANTRVGFVPDIPPLYASAWKAWLGTEQHNGVPPNGVDVPVFFSYTTTIDGVKENYGHIGIRLANGQFWSDGTIYASISAYTANHKPVYVGWGESINKVRVISYKGEDMEAAKVDKNFLNAFYIDLMGRGASEAEQKIYVGRDWKVVYNELRSSQEHADYLKSLGGGYTQVTDIKQLNLWIKN